MSLLFPILLLLFEFVGNLSTDMYLPSFLTLAKDFSVSNGVIQNTVTTWFLGLTLAQILLGPLSDRFGRRPILLTSGLLFLIGSFWCAISHSIYELLTARVCQGIGVGGAMLSGRAVVNENYAEHKATVLLAWITTMASISRVLGPLFGSYVLLFADWRVIFWILFALGALITLFLFFKAPETLKEENKHPLHPIAILKTYSHHLLNRKFLGCALAFSFIVSGNIIWITVSPIIIMQKFKASQLAYGHLQLPVFVGLFIGGQLVQFLLKRFGRIGLIYLGMLLSSISAIAMIFLHHSLAHVLTAMSFYALGVGIAAAPLFKEAVHDVLHGKGMAVSLFLLLMSLIITLMTTITSLLPDSTTISGVFILVVTLTALFSFRILRQ